MQERGGGASGLCYPPNFHKETSRVVGTGEGCVIVLTL